MECECDIVSSRKPQRKGPPHAAAVQAQQLTGVRDTAHHEAVRLHTQLMFGKHLNGPSQMTGAQSTESDGAAHDGESHVRLVQLAFLRSPER